MKGKIENWYEENKEEIKAETKRVGWIALGLGVGYLTGKKISDLKLSVGLERAHVAGIIKFIDPTTGLEIAEREVTGVINKVFNK